jgi:hypothetical protein
MCACKKSNGGKVKPANKGGNKIIQKLIKRGK